MPKGLPISYIKKWGISKLAWKKFRAGALTKGVRTRTRAIKRRITRSRRKPRHNPRKKVRRMVRRRRGRRRGGKSITRTAFKLLRLGALAGPGIHQAMSSQSNEKKINNILACYTGFSMEDGKFYWQWLARGWTPYAMACLTTYGIPKLTSIIRKL